MVVAVIVLVIGIGAALGALSAATKSAETAGNYSTASILAQQKISEIESQPDNLNSGSGDFGADYPNYQWQSTIENTDLPTVSKLTLTIQWRSGNIQKQAQFVTYEPSNQGAYSNPTTVPTATTSSTGTGR